MISRWKFDLDTKDLLPNFLTFLMKPTLHTPVISWEKMVANDDQGYPFEVEGEYRSSERPNFR